LPEPRTVSPSAQEKEVKRGKGKLPAMLQKKKGELTELDEGGALTRKGGTWM